MKAIHNLMERIDVTLIARSTSFYAMVFRGLGKYDRINANTLAAARFAARGMFTGRPVAIYGLTPEGRSVFIENVDLKRDQPITEGETMSVYVLTYRVPAINHPEVFKMPPGADKVRAAGFIQSLPEEVGTLIVETVDDVGKFSGPLMVKLYNEFITKRDLPAIKKFENLAIGKNRLFREVIDAAVDISDEKLTEAEAAAKTSDADTVTRDPAPAENEEFVEDTPATDTSTSSTDAVTSADDQPPAEEIPMAKAKTATKRKSKVNLDKKIKVLADENPKRKGTAAYKRFALYKNGAKVSTYVEHGGRLSDLTWDIAHKFVKLED